MYYRSITIIGMSTIIGNVDLGILVHITYIFLDKLA
jgi:hypothetical protein